MSMKTCTKCKIQKDLSDFSNHKNRSDGLEYWCRDCKNFYSRDYRNKNLIKYREYSSLRLKQRISWLHTFKQKPCKDCNQMYEPYCMDFDHLPEYDKINAITRMVLNNAPKDRILQEIEKCDLVCILCHNRRTQKRFDEKYPNKKYPKYSLRNIEIINEARNNPCVMCGCIYEPYNMQLDHIDPYTKFKNICQLKGFKLDTLIKELEKCQVLCALCHRRKSIYEQQAKKYPTSRIKPPKTFLDLENKIKECVRCHQHLSFEKFHKHNNKKIGLNSWCKECVNSYKREKRKNK